MPYSPRWLIDKDRIDEGLKTLAALRETSIDHPVVRAEFDEINNELAAEKAMGKRTYAELFVFPNRRRFFCAAFIAIATSFTGTVAIW